MIFSTLSYASFNLRSTFQRRPGCGCELTGGIANELIGELKSPYDTREDETSIYEGLRSRVY